MKKQDCAELQGVFSDTLNQCRERFLGKNGALYRLGFCDGDFHCNILVSKSKAGILQPMLGIIFP